MKELLFNTELISEKELYKITKDIFEFNVLSGLPCGELRHFISEGATDTELLHIRSSNEREAIGIACGSWLANKTPALYMQNSGFFESSNDIGSLLIPCKIPALFVTSWRGAPGENATQHLYTGTATIPLLDAFGVPYILNITEKNLIQLKNKMSDLQRPGFILVRKEEFNDSVTTNTLEDSIINDPATIEVENNKIKLSRDGALKSIFDSLNTNDAVISSTGLISRSVFHHYDANNQFYNTGAFGLTSLIGLGFSLNKPETRTVVIEGDGSLLTNLGSLNTIANSKPPNFVHIVLDNKVYASCSGEPTFGSSMIPLVARDLGYKNIFVVNSKEYIENILKRILQPGPTLIHIQINTDGCRNLKRPLNMANIAERFRKKFSKI